jgi:hypothetical protein
LSQHFTNIDFYYFFDRDIADIVNENFHSFKASFSSSVLSIIVLSAAFVGLSVVGLFFLSLIKKRESDFYRSYAMPIANILVSLTNTTSLLIFSLLPAILLSSLLTLLMAKTIQTTFASFQASLGIASNTDFSLFIQADYGTFYFLCIVITIVITVIENITLFVSRKD